jgi:transketolase
MNVKLIGISGGVSYGTLGMTHHSTQDIAVLSSLSNMRVYLPSDRRQTRKLFTALADDGKPAYIRVGRNPVPDVYLDDDMPFTTDKAVTLHEGTDAAIIACGETVHAAFEAAKALAGRGVRCRVLDMYCLKPLDVEVVIAAARETRFIVTVEEHGIIGGLGSLVSHVTAANHPAKVISVALPDAPVISGTSGEVFGYYGLCKDNLVNIILKELGI